MKSILNYSTILSLSLSPLQTISQENNCENYFQSPEGINYVQVRHNGDLYFLSEERNFHWSSHANEFPLRINHVEIPQKTKSKLEYLLNNCIKSDTKPKENHLYTL